MGELVLDNYVKGMLGLNRLAANKVNPTTDTNL